MDILNSLIIIPILTVIALLLVKDLKQIRLIAAIGMFIELIQSIRLLFMYRAERAGGNSSEMVFQKSYQWFESMNIQYNVGVDGISVVMILLTAIIIFSAIFASWKVTYLAKEFFILLIILSVGAFGFFISLDLFALFFFLEIAIIPKFLLIAIWGSGKKEYSAMKLALMLMGGSALILIGLLMTYFNTDIGGGVHTWNLLEIAKMQIPLAAQLFIFPFLFIGFGIFTALFPFHTWVPDGHSSAPTAASMFLAGISMKLGGYGCLRVATYLMPEAANEMAWIFIILTSISVIYGALGTLAQTDLKYINAYSSLSHCGLILFAILMMNKTSFNGAILQMISHGLMTAMFFALIGMIYERVGTRDIKQLGGLMKVMPFLAVLYVIAGLASLGLPGLSGFVAEMTIFVGAFQHEDIFHRIATIIAISSIVVTAVYILRVVGKVLFGPFVNEAHAKLTDALWHEKLPLIVLLIAIVGIGVAPLWLSDLIMDSLQPIIAKLALATH